MLPLKVKIIEPVVMIREMFLRQGFEVISPHHNDVPNLICFTGGEDVSPSLYNETRLNLTHNNPQRDIRDQVAFDQFKKTPKIGICRGGQFLNVMSGGTMWQHVSGHATSVGHGLQNLLHIPGYVEQDLLRVSSTHHQMMRAGEKGEVIAISYDEDDNGETKSLSNTFLTAGKDKTVPKFDTEVVWYPETKSLCYQPHPEFGADTQNSKYFFDLINYFFFLERTNKKGK